MSDTSGTLWITFNGEIYNWLELRQELSALGHVFRSRTDTEVILAAYREWGIACLERLNGMFAFALYDAAREHLFLARDRAGEKPLFYWYRNGTLSFASELKALMADPELERRLDPVSLDYFLAFGYVPGERCILRGVHKLPPAHAAIFRLETGELKIWRYWELPPPPPEQAVPDAEEPEELLSELEHLLTDSVKRQLIADVPVGILLSGGVDSSLITAVAARNAPRIQTYTITFPDYPSHDEARHARLIAEHFATDHHELAASPASLDLLPKLAAQFDEPIVDSSMIPTYLVCNLVRQYCTVALSGDGGDELFGGYSHYCRLLRMERAIGWIPRPLRAVAAKMAMTVLPIGFRGRNYFLDMGIDFTSQAPRLARLFDKQARLRLTPPDIREFLQRHAVLRENDQQGGGADLLDRVERDDFCRYLPEDLLVKMDRMAMLNSLEVRAPLLDYRVVQFAFGKVPSRLKADQRRKKILLKALGKRLLPQRFDWERKQGFSIPLAAWLRGEWREAFGAILLDRTEPLFNRNELERLWRNHQRGFSNSERLFGLVLFELWRERYGVKW